jgi:hypothetical protein
MCLQFITEVIMSQPAKKLRREHDIRRAAQMFDPESCMDMPLLGAFFGGKSLPTISRWRKHPDPDKRLPAPDLFVGSVPYWFRKTIIAYRDRLAELQRSRLARESAPAVKPPETAPSAQAPAAGATQGNTSRRLGG